MTKTDSILRLPYNEIDSGVCYSYEVFATDNTFKDLILTSRCIQFFEGVDSFSWELIVTRQDPNYSSLLEQSDTTISKECYVCDSLGFVVLQFGGRDTLYIDNYELIGLRAVTTWAGGQPTITPRSGDDTENFEVLPLMYGDDPKPTENKQRYAWRYY